MAGNLKAEVMAEWAGGEHIFRLTVSAVLELEQRCGAAFGTIFKRVNSGDFAVNDLIEIVRLGLIGGGMTTPDATRLIKLNVFPERPLGELLPLAKVILGAAMFGFEVAPLGNQGAAGSPNG